MDHNLTNQTGVIICSREKESIFIRRLIVLGTKILLILLLLDQNNHIIQINSIYATSSQATQSALIVENHVVSTYRASLLKYPDIMQQTLNSSTNAKMLFLSSPFSLRENKLGIIHSRISREQLLYDLNFQIQRIENEKIAFIFQEDTINTESLFKAVENIFVSFSEIGITIHVKELEKRLWFQLLQKVTLGKSGLLQQESTILPFKLGPYIQKEIYEKKYNVVSFSEEKIEKMVSDIFSSYNYPPVDGKVIVEEKNIVFIKDKKGRSISSERIVSEVKKKINEWEYMNISKLNNISVQIITLSGDITYENLELSNNLLGGGKSSLKEDKKRYPNIVNAIGKAQGYVLQPGEIFSANAIFGPYVVEEGYTSSSVFTTEDIVSGVGGGVCQVTSTLYQAALLAELEIIERHPHQYLVDYSEATLDAAVSNKEQDFKFRNNQRGLIFIVFEINEGYLTAQIYGQEVRPKNRSIEFKVEIESTYGIRSHSLGRDNGERHGQVTLRDGPRVIKQGCLASLYKYIFYEGELIERIYVYRDYYKILDE